MRRVLLALVLAAGTFAFPAAAGAPAPTWAEPDAPRRVRVGLPELLGGAPPKGTLSTARARLALPGARPDGRDVRVRPAGGGGALPRRVERVRAGDGANEYDVYFPYAKGVREYDVYFGGAPGAASSWKPVPGGLYLRTLENVGGARAGSLSQIRSMVKSSAKVHGEGPREKIDDLENPFGPDDNYLSHYEGYLVCPEAGEYGLAVDGDDSIFLLIDGSLAVGWPGAHGVRGKWDRRHRRTLRLTAGLHRITVYHAESSGGQAARAGWRPPWEKEYSVIAPAFFARYLDAVPVELESRDAGGAVRSELYFAYRELAQYRVNDANQTALVEFTACAPRTSAAEHAWSFPGGLTRKGTRVRAYFTPGRPREVTLRAGDAAFERRVLVKPRPATDLPRIYLEVGLDALPAFVYADEKVALNPEAVNDSGWPIEAALAWRWESAGRRPAEGQEELHLTSDGEASRGKLHLPLVARDWRRGGRQTYALRFGGDDLVKKSVRVLRGDADWGNLGVRAAGGHLDTAAGARVLVLLEPENAAEDRYWAWPRALARARPRAPGRVLYFGDPMAQDEDASGVLGLLHAWEARGEGRTLSVVRWEGLYPCMGALAAIDGALAESTPDLVVLAPGQLDARAGTPLRRFERALDAMLDRVRVATRGRARIAIQSPIPEVSALPLARRYERSARRVAERHAARYINLLDALAGENGWEALYRDPDAGERVHGRYPAAEGQEALARAFRRAMGWP